MGKWVKYILLCMGILAGSRDTLYGQNQNNIWFFGKKAGINFNPATPAALQTSFTLMEGMSTVCDPQTGALLFSTDGKTVWTKYHTQMPNGTNLLGNTDNTTLQGVCVVPVIDSPGKYYLFSLEYQASRFLPPQQLTPFSQGRLFYSVVDLSLNNGLGDVVTTRKNILLDSRLSESMIAVPGTNCDIWLLAHAVDTSIFKAWHITRSGFNPVPVVSHAGWQVQGPGSYNQGCMAASPDGKLVAITSLSVVTGYPPDTSKGTVICRFDGATGILSDGIRIDPFMAYGVAFSPDNKLLYVNNWDPRERGMFQFDVSNYTPAAIAASKTNINSGTTSTYLRRFRDKIYFSQQLRACLGRINNPNIAGTGCDYQDSAIALYPGTITQYALPGDVVYPFPKDTLHTRTDTSLCAARQPITLEGTPGYDTYLWDDSSVTATRSINRAGTYWVICGDYCHSRIDTIVIQQKDSLFFTTDSILCRSQSTLTLEAPAGYNTRQWDDHSANQSRIVDVAGTYWVSSYDACVPRTDTFRVSKMNFSRFGLGADTNICNNMPLILHAQVSDAEYLWQDGSTDSIYRVSRTGTYWIQAGKSNCYQRDTIDVIYRNLPEHYLPEDSVICREDRMVLSITIPEGAEAIWSDGTTGSRFETSDSGHFWVTVSIEPCSAADTMHLHQEACDCRFDIPTAFTPDGNGKNDFFRLIVEPSCTIKNYNCRIFNRWGQLVYYSTDPGKSWDGLYKGQPAEAGTYMFTISFEGGARGKTYFRTGDMTLIR